VLEFHLEMRLELSAKVGGDCAASKRLDDARGELSE
jgi:hypothetical protein